MSDPLDAAGEQFARENPDEVPPPPEAEHAPGSRAEPQPSSPPPREEPKEAPSTTAIPMEEIAEMGVAVIDFGIQNFVSKRCAFKPEQRAELGELGTKVLKKWFPDIEGAIEPEYAFAGAVALFAFVNYKNSSPGLGSDGASPGGGSGGGSGNSGDPSKKTEASVDGKRVNAEVIS